MSQNSERISKERLEYLEKLEKEKALQDLKNLLPHKYTTLYKWQREYLESTNKSNFITAANQVGKSSINIIKTITWATEKELWPKLWPEKVKQNKPITCFFYLYPDKDSITREFNEKWKKEWLPRGSMKNDPKYGWKENIAHKHTHSIDFNSGVTLYFLSYSQDVRHLQASTVYAVFADEELPFTHYSELRARLTNTDGYFNLVFTAIEGQDEWRRTMEEIGTPEELFKGAFKRQISLYDCQKYEDGTPSSWTNEKIQGVINTYGTSAQIQRRVYGRFIKESGLRFQAFDRKTNVVNLTEQKKLPSNWLTFAGIDIGSGGESGHPAAITFVKVNPEFTRGYIYKCWRGDGISTTASDVLKQYRDMKGSAIMTAAYYDWASKEFGLVAQRAGEPVQMANKSREKGTQILNTLFRNRMLKIYEDEESRKLINELVSLGVDNAKQHAKDDLIDSMVYATTSIPWDFSCVNDAPIIDDKPVVILDDREAFVEKQRKGLHLKEDDINEQENMILSELSEWDEYFNG